ncbi:MmcQ/YjbR family DNA-binding protein [Streptomyces phyllanthi]|uniref:MmcQ/YjbR family DNA-binding protein n=2 Tax=Streptomyces phyllanthi TaxID=1803180 RepID=A0A5N8W9J8_9ACTN|nr:MmcQ/YjbR family DNA-binding protein [Streptomyces phyllanthi]
MAPATVRLMPDAEDVRRIALSLPDTTEKIAWSMPTFRVAGKMFATLPEDETSIAVRCPKEERDELVLAEPDKFWIADHEAGFAWVRVRLAALENETELRDILADSWRQAAPSRLLESHPRLGLPATG